MRTTITLAFLLLSACGSAPSLSPAEEAAVAARSAAIADRFQEELQAALKAAMAEAGPAGAIAVCADFAPALAAHLSEETGASVRRTALRVRNPASKADAFERETMAAWERGHQTADGRPVTRLAAMAGPDGAPTVRWMRAIPTAPLCTTCHGAAVAPDVAAAIALRYPEDRATGFRPGDLRGAFSIAWTGDALAAAKAGASGAAGL
jgi:hypothetical protein